MLNSHCLLIVTIFLAACFYGSSQNVAPDNAGGMVNGQVLDTASDKPLSYVNISVKRTHEGIISNENGEYALDELIAFPSDTICFHHIGFETFCQSMAYLQENPRVYLKKNIFNISEVVVVPDDFDPADIINKVVQNRSSNYLKTTSKRQVFIRQRNITHFKNFKINTSKKTPEVINNYAEHLNSMMNRKFVSYIDLIGNYFQTANDQDTVKSKFECSNAVSLNPDVIGLRLVSDSVTNYKIFETDSNEYWKMKSGMLGITLVDTDRKMERDTLNTIEKTDTTGGRSSLIMLGKIDENLAYANLKNEAFWTFLYETNKYEFVLEGGTNINDENVYIIRFNPKRRGIYQGKLYISTETYALLRADYEYGEGKTGQSIQLLGIGYKENMYKASIYYEKNAGTYHLKQFSQQHTMDISIKRPLRFLKKRKRKLFDKTLTDIKTDLDLNMTENESFELYIVDEEQITDESYSSLKQKAYHMVHYIDSLNTNKWSEFSKIAPVKL